MNLINEKAIDDYVKKFNFKQMLIFPVILLTGIAFDLNLYYSYNRNPYSGRTGNGIPGRNGHDL